MARLAEVAITKGTSSFAEIANYFKQPPAAATTTTTSALPAGAASTAAAAPASSMNAGTNAATVAGAANGTLNINHWINSTLLD